MHLYIRGLVNKGYKAHESFRVFDMEHELNVALVSKDGEYYIVIIDPCLSQHQQNQNLTFNHTF